MYPSNFSKLDVGAHSVVVLIYFDRWGTNLFYELTKTPVIRRGKGFVFLTTI